jgi:hypothetical protein
MRYIELTDREDGDRVLVNPGHVTHVTQRSTGTRVYLRDEAFVDVSEDLDAVRRLLEEEAA